MNYFFKKYLALLILLSLLSSCSFKTAFEDIQPSAVPPQNAIIPTTPQAKMISLAPKGEFLSGSLDFNETPLRKYKVLTSAGSINKEIALKTQHGYKVYFSDIGILYHPKY